MYFILHIKVKEYYTIIILMILILIHVYIIRVTLKHENHSDFYIYVSNDKDDMLA